MPPHAPKRIAILGSTGSIGNSALDVIQHLGQEYVTVAALSAHSQHEKLLEQTRQFHPNAVAVTDRAAYCEVQSAIRTRDRPSTRSPQLYDNLPDLVRRDDIDLVLAAVVGAAGLPAVFAAVEARKTIALANKESLVVAGSLLIPLARKLNVPILPVDSEHSAIFQAMQAGRPSEVKRLILTASGGPFRNAPVHQIESATLADALNHPTWRMGNKITIDSATMFNKGLELIEACWLFDLPPERIDIVIHPQSIVHSMVEFVDGNVIAQLSPPDMRTPIQYALTWPDRLPSHSKKLDLTRPLDLDFHPPDPDRFPALDIAREVARGGGTLGAVMNAANEVAVQSFTSGNIPFGMIWRTVRHTIDEHDIQPTPALSDLLDADKWARGVAEQYITENAQLSSHGRLQ